MYMQDTRKDLLSFTQVFVETIQTELFSSLTDAVLQAFSSWANHPLASYGGGAGCLQCKSMMMTC